MRSERRNKLIILVLLLVGVCTISIGFSSLSTTLKIDSSATVNPDSSNFSVKFSSSLNSLATDPVAPSSKSSGLETTDATIVNSATPTIGGYTATFTQDGQYVTYSFYVRNTGNYTAYLNSITFGDGTSCEAKKGTSDTSVSENCANVSTATTVKVGNITATGTTVDITEETLDPNESKLVEVTFEYIGGGSAIGGDFSIEFPSITLYYASTNGLNSPQDDPSRYETSTSTTSSLMLSNVISTTLKNYRIYGSSDGVGDSSDSGYVIPVTVRGKNLFSSQLIKGYTLNTTTGAESEKSTASVTDYIPVKITDSSYHLSGLTNTLWSFIAAYNENKEFLGRTSGTARTSITLTKTIFTLGTAQGTGDIAYIRVTVYQNGTASTGTLDDIDNLNIQLEEGTSVTAYEQYVTPTSFNIVLSSPLMEGDYIDFETQTVVRSNGTTESINIPAITTLSVPTTIIEVETTNVPSTIEATYFQ